MFGYSIQEKINVLDAELIASSSILERIKSFGSEISCRQEWADEIMTIVNTIQQFVGAIKTDLKAKMPLDRESSRESRKKPVSDSEINRLSASIDSTFFNPKWGINELLQSSATKFKKGSYKRYFEAVQGNVSQFADFCKSTFVPKLANVNVIRRIGRKISRFRKLFRLLNAELQFYEKEVMKRLVTCHSLLHGRVRKIEAKLGRALHTLRTINDPISGYARMRGDARESQESLQGFGTGTFDGQIRIRKASIKLIEKSFEKAEELTNELKSIYDPQYLAQVNYFKDTEEAESRAKQTLLGLQIEHDFLCKFKEAYEQDSQQAIAMVFQEYISAGGTPGVTVAGIGTGLTAYTGIVASRQAEGSWRLQEEINIPPAAYAKRLRTIVVTSGYEPSLRGLNPAICGVYNIKNIYFYTNPHDMYGGQHALVSWDLSPFCVFTGKAIGFRASGQVIAEGFFVTPINIPPEKLTLLVSKPERLTGGDRDYQEQLIAELERLGVPFTYR